jgi:hypothetical protein
MVVWALWLKVCVVMVKASVEWKLAKMNYSMLITNIFLFKANEVLLIANELLLVAKELLLKRRKRGGRDLGWKTWTVDFSKERACKCKDMTGNRDFNISISTFLESVPRQFKQRINHVRSKEEQRDIALTNAPIR